MKRQVVIVTIVVLVVAGAIAVAATLSHQTPIAGGTSTPTVTTSASTKPTTTPTATPSARTSEAPKSPTVTPQPAPSSPSTSAIPGAAAVVTLATYDASKAVVVVGGFVSGVKEDGGTCTFTVVATDTGASASLDSTGAFNVDSTTCGSHEIGAPKSKSGAYSVTLKYSNAVGAVTSSPVPVEGS